MAWGNTALLDRPFTRIVLPILIVVIIAISEPTKSLGKGQFWVGITSQEFGYGLQQAREGTPLIVSSRFLNIDGAARNVTVFSEIRKDDITVQLEWTEVVAPSLESVFSSALWTPESPGVYEVRSFIVSNLTRPEVLQEGYGFDFNVVSDEDVATLYQGRQTRFEAREIEPAHISQTEVVTLGKTQGLTEAIRSQNTYIGDVAVTEGSVFLIGTAEIPPLREKPPDDGGNILVFFAASTDRGKSFEPGRFLMNNTRAINFAHSPKIYAVNDTLLYGSWLQQSYPKDEFKHVFVKSSDRGRTFDYTDLDAAGWGRIEMAASPDGKSIFLLRTETNTQGEEYQTSMLVSRSQDYGETFSPAQLVVNHTGSGIDCIMLETQKSTNAGESNILLSWRQTFDDSMMEVVFTRSNDSGITFESPTIIRRAYAESGDCPVMQSDDENVHLIWTETRLIYKQEDPSEILVGDSDVYFVASHNEGRSFEPPVNVSEGIGALTMEPKIAISHGTVNIVWRDTLPERMDGFLDFYGNAEVIMARSLDGGETFESPVNLSNNPTGSYQPSIAAVGDSVVISWLESEFPSDEATVSLLASEDRGETFSKVRNDSAPNLSEFVSPPRVLMFPDGQELYFVWSQREHGSYIAEFYGAPGKVENETQS